MLKSCPWSLRYCQIPVEEALVPTRARRIRRLYGGKEIDFGSRPPCCTLALLFRTNARIE